MMNLRDFVKLIDFKFPKCLACKWDNVGLLVNPPDVVVKKIMLTNDLTSKVVKEAKTAMCDMIICYHPVIFSGVKRFDHSGYWKDSLCLDAYSNKIAIYCPHTSLDVIDNGVNDWLVNAFKEFGIASKSSIIPYTDFSSHYPTCSVIPKNKLDIVAKYIMRDESVDFFCMDGDNTNEIQVFHNKTLDIEGLDASSPVTCKSVSKNLMSKRIGEGRIVTLKENISLNDCINSLKTYLGLKTLKIALAKNSDLHRAKIKTIAFCAGSGGSVLKNVKCDLVVTGELLHHSILDFCESDTNVILTHHSNSERGFLQVYSKQIKTHLINCGIEESTIPKFLISESDCDPVFIV